jgi:hypothetical protein
MAIVLVAACGSSSKSGSSGTNNTSATTAAKNQTLGQGVTDTQVKLGVSLIDFSCIRQFTDNIRENQDKNYNIYINDVNANGGVAGRKIVPVYHTFCPINQQQVSSGCTQFAEDDKVFAVVGNVYDTSGSVQVCLAKQHKIPIMSFQLSKAIEDKAPGGLMIYPGNNPERLDAVIVKQLKDQNTLAGKKIAIVGGSANVKSIKDSLEPAVKSLGIPTGTTAILNVGTTGDTTAAQTQLDSFIDTWKGEGTNALFITGTEVASKQFVEKIRKAMPDVTLVTDIQDVRTFGREEKAAKMNPNPYEGILSTTGPTAQEYQTSDNWKFCEAIYQKATGKLPPQPTDVIKFPDGKINDDYGSIDDACQLINLFKSIGDKIGKPLNSENWQNAVNTYGPIVDRGGGQYASLTQGKYDTNDTFRLVAFDSSIGDGDWKPLSELQNVPNS